MYTLQSREKKLRDGVLQDHIIFLVDQILYRAIETRSSDIHLEPTFSCPLRLRYRIDGELYDQKPISQHDALLVISRLKILTSLDIAQRRMPQDGKLMLKFISDDMDGSFRTIDLRVSTFPTIFGEKMVIRILDHHWQRLSLEALGCSQQALDVISKLIERPHGFFLVTGPTGSGKTTTLYALLSKLNSPGRNIVTMEDPVEYHIEGITQSQIDEKIGFTFERGLRSLVRQDPDVAMVGEIRDRATAQVAVEAALTGHLVLSTLHTNDSVGAITRLIDMGIEPFLVNASVSAVLAQRLARVLCDECKYQTDGTWRADGCKACMNLGHKGRTGLFELLVLDGTIRRLIIGGVDDQTIREHAIANGMLLLGDDGMCKVKQGVISLEECLRVVSSI